MRPEEVENEQVEELPSILKLPGRIFWMGTAVYCFKKITSYEVYRPSMWLVAKWAYIALVAMAIGSSMYLRIRIGPNVPRYRWRMYIPMSIYLITFLNIASFVFMLLAFGISPVNFLLMSGVNIGMLSFLSFL